MRKLFHTKLANMRDRVDVMKLISQVDRHTQKIAESVYVAKSPEDDAKLGEILFKAVFGEPVPWPSAEQRELASATGSDSMSYDEKQFDDIVEEDDDDDIPESEVYVEEAVVKRPPSDDDLKSDCDDESGSDDEGEHPKPPAKGAVTLAAVEHRKLKATQNSLMKSIEGAKGPDEVCKAVEAAKAIAEGTGQLPPPKKARKETLFPEAASAFLQSENNKLTSGKSMATNEFLREILGRGQAKGVVAPDRTLEQVRTHLRGKVGT